MPFSTFIGYCKEHKQKTEDGCGGCVEPERHLQVGSETEEPCLLPGDIAPQQIYLAQVIKGSMVMYTQFFLLILDKYDVFTSLMLLRALSC